MKCAQHISSDAIGTCCDCGKGLCTQCVDRFTKPFCDQCLLKYSTTMTRHLYIGLSATVMAFIIGFYLWYFFLQGYLSTAIIIGLLLAGTYWGWIFLHDRLFTLKTQNYSFKKKLFILPCYYLFKLVLACAIGIFIGSYQIYKIFEGLQQAKKIKQQLKGK